MTTQDQQLDRARQLGRDAFRAGTICAPSADSNLLAMLVGREFGVTPEGQAPTTMILKAWSTGWALENLASV